MLPLAVGPRSVTLPTEFQPRASVGAPADDYSRRIVSPMRP